MRRLLTVVLQGSSLLMVWGQCILRMSLSCLRWKVLKWCFLGSLSMSIFHYCRGNIGNVGIEGSQFNLDAVVPVVEDVLQCVVGCYG